MERLKHAGVGLRLPLPPGRLTQAIVEPMLALPQRKLALFCVVMGAWHPLARGHLLGACLGNPGSPEPVLLPDPGGWGAKVAVFSPWVR